MSSRHAISRLADRLLIAAFFAVLWLPLLAKALHWGGGQSLNENRRLAKAPDFRRTPLAALPKQIDAFVQDHLPFRASLIRCYAIVRHQYMGLRSNSIVLGNDGWLFFDLNGCQTRDYMGQIPLTREQLEQWKMFLECRQAYLAERGIRYLFVVAPNQVSIYPEMLPNAIRAKGVSRHEQLIEFLAKESSVEVLDLRQPLQEAKQVGQVYYRADTHWTGLGCSVAMQSICERLHHWFPEVQWQPLGGELELRKLPAPTNMWDMLGLDAGKCPEETCLVRRGSPRSQIVAAKLPSNWDPPPKNTWIEPVARTNQSAKHRLLVMGDSFFARGLADASDRPLADHFGYSMFATNMNCGRCPHAQLQSLVDQEHPDVVVEEMVERYLELIPEAVAMAPVAKAEDVLTASRRTERKPSDAGYIR